MQKKFPVGLICLSLSVVTLALPAVAQDLPNMREARRMIFARDGAVSVEFLPDPALQAGDRALLENELFQAQLAASISYYGAVALSPGMGLQSEATVAASNFHDEENARAFALQGCEAARHADTEDEGCVVVMVLRPEGWEPDRPLQLNTDATAALWGAYRHLGRPRAMAISDATGHWGIGESEETAVADCGQADCRIVIRN